MPGYKLGETNVLGRIGGASEPSKYKTAHCSPTHKEREPEVISASISVGYRRSGILLPKDCFTKAESLCSGGLSPCELCLSRSSSTQGTCVCWFENSALLILNVEGNCVENENRARQTKDSIQPGFGVERLRHDAGDGIDRVELSAVRERFGRYERTGHDDFPETGMMKLNVLPFPSMLSTVNSEP